MNITNNDYEVLKSAINVLRTVELPVQDQKIVSSAVSVMDGLRQKKENDNTRIAAYIKDKRKENKNYARGIK